MYPKWNRGLTIGISCCVLMLAACVCQSINSNKDVAIATEPPGITVAELTETTITTKESFGQTDYPLLAALPDYYIYLYAIDKTIPGGRVLLRAGEYLQEFDWDWLSEDFVLPQLSIESLKAAEADRYVPGTNGQFTAYAIHCRTQTHNGQINHFLIQQGDEFVDYPTTPEDLTPYVLERVEGDVSEDGLKITIEDMTYLLPLPAGITNDNSQLNFEVTNCYYRMPDVILSRLSTPDVSVTFNLSCLFEQSEQALDLNLEFALSGIDELFPEGYYFGSDEGGSLPIQDVELRLADHNLPYYLDYHIALMFAGSDLVLLPGTEQPVSPDLAPIKLDIKGYTLELPGQWKDEYFIVHPDVYFSGEAVLEREWLFKLCDEKNAGQFPTESQGFLCGIELASLQDLLIIHPAALEEGRGARRVIGTKGDHAFIYNIPTGVEYHLDSPYLTQHYLAMRRNLQSVLEEFMTLNKITPNPDFPRWNKYDYRYRDQADNQLSNKVDDSSLESILYENHTIGFSMQIPTSWEGKYSVEDYDGDTYDNEIIEKSISVIHNASRDEGKGGWLFSIGRASGEHFTEDEPPSMSGQTIIFEQTGGCTYYMHFPSGVEYNEDPESKSAAEYKEMRSQVDLLIDTFKLIEN